MNYIKVNQSGNVYPYPLWQLRDDYPNVSFPQPYESVTLSDFGVYPVADAAQPAFDRRTHKVVEGAPVMSNGAWTQAWDVVPLSAQEQADVAQTIMDEIVAATQKRLDDFAKTRNYDGILSACTYATSPTPKFAAEGRYCVASRDATWAKLYEMLNEVQAGTRPVPAGFADVEPELPVLAWPN